jgi:phenylacetate-CoA ligase
MTLDLPQLGDPAAAHAVARRAAQRVPAYRRHLAARQIDPAALAWTALPTMDKKDYLLAHPFADLLADDFGDPFTIFSSSGSSGRPFYWPQLKGAQREAAARLRQLLEEVYRIHERKTLAIVGLALGSWIGGEHFSWVLKSVAVDAPYAFAVFSPGNRHDEIIAMIESAGCFVDQVIVFACPSAIGHLRLRAEQQGRALPLAKLRFVVLGEPFPESVRLGLQAEASLAPGEPAMISIFGSADTGVLGVESPASALVRGVCERDATLAADLGFGGVVPHLFHQADPSALLESVDGELCVTKWQGVPLVRYNLHDAVRLLRWSALVERVASRLGDGPMTQGLRASAARLPDVLAVTGRADSCLLLCGTNLTEAMLDTAVRSPELAAALTGNYRARVILEHGRQRLEFTLECRGGIAPDDATASAIYPLLVTALGRAQPEFKDDWDNIYRRWDDDSAHRILALRLVAWPALAEDKRVKHRGVQA